MLSRRLFKNNVRKRRFAHIGFGVVILIHSYEKFESGHESFKLFALAGFVFLLIAIFHPVIEKKIPWVDGVFFVIEGILSIIVAVDFFYLGKKALPVTYILLGLFQFFMAYRVSKKGIRHHKMKSQESN